MFSVKDKDADEFRIIEAFRFTTLSTVGYDSGLTTKSIETLLSFTFGESKPISIILLSFGDKILELKASNIAIVQPLETMRSLSFCVVRIKASIIASTLPLLRIVTFRFPLSPGSTFKYSSFLSIVTL